MATVKDIMVKQVVTISEDRSLKDISKLLMSKKLSGIPVVNKKDDLTGFISERDIIKAVGEGSFSNKKISDVMTKRVFTVQEGKPAEQVSQIFTDKPFRYVPVMRGNKLVGIVSRKDVISKLLGKYY